ncbi:hypothetical protein RchiOBHm_Chr7g0236551 [Rosa chinensis]|uniref:Uncharacterized protein n=1 Tax=Rosa chinensis TaxID=74649 RepID=A0A2P6PH00_ROSCH|nr:hypothetical protein RchiOBHm_Chr7g0236551 [Rosa chinensis]
MLTKAKRRRLYLNALRLVLLMVLLVLLMYQISFTSLFSLCELRLPQSHDHPIASIVNPSAQVYPMLRFDHGYEVNLVRQHQPSSSHVATNHHKNRQSSST